MAETIDDLTGKQITDAAILQLINHWLMEYKPEDTVDPTSDGVPTGKAIANYIAKHSGLSFKTTQHISDKSQEGKGTIIDITDIVGTDVRQKNIWLSFNPSTQYHDYYTGYAYWSGMHCDFAGVRFAVNAIPNITDSAVLSDMQRGVPYPYAPTGFDPYFSLQYTYFHDDETTPSFTKLHRTAMMYKSNNRYYIYLSALRRSYINKTYQEHSAPVIDLNVNGVPTSTQAQKLTVNDISIMLANA